MAASSSGSCQSLNSDHVKAGEMGSADPRPHTSVDAGLCARDTFCHGIQGGGHTYERSQPASHCQGGRVTRETDDRNSVPTRKAEREKLRRDRLNEQLLELAGALEPDRPKNDKSTILGDAIQSLREMMVDVERLRAEHALLVDESEDLCQEKKELHEERQQLMSNVQRLQSLVGQQMHAMLLWMATDPAMMGAYTASLSAHDVDAQARPPLGPSQVPLPFVGHQPMPFLPSPLSVHPALQAHYGYSGRGAPYLPYSFNYANGAPIQAEVPCAQVSQGYPPQVYHSPLTRPMQPVSQAAPYTQAYGSHFLFTTPTAAEFQNLNDVGAMAGPSAACTEPSADLQKRR